MQMEKKNELHVITMVKKISPGSLKEYWENDFRKYSQEHSSIYFVYFQVLLSMVFGE